MAIPHCIFSPLPSRHHILKSEVFPLQVSWEAVHSWCYMLPTRLTQTELSLITTGNATTQLFHPALALPFSLLRASGSSPPGLLLWEQKPQKRRNVFTWQFAAFLFIGNMKIYIPCSMHGRKKGELSQGHTGGSPSGSSLIPGQQ